MKKILNILTLTITLFLVNCGGDDEIQPVDPQIQSLEEILVGVKWCLSNQDEDGFKLLTNGDFVITKKCISNETLGKWILDSNLIKYSYIDNSIQTTVLWGQITEYSVNQVKILINNSSTSTSEAIYSPTSEDVYGCIDSSAFNYNPLSTCDDNSCRFQMTYIPDDNFEQLLIDLGHDDILDDSVITKNISSLIFLNFDNSHKVYNFTGLEDFISLNHLNINFCCVQNINIENNVNLKKIYFNNNEYLESIQINNCSNLEVLSINHGLLEDNEKTLSSLSINNCTSIKDISIGFTKITNLNFSNYSNLETLSIANNQLTNLDVSYCSNLKDLFCEDNQLTSLNISGCSNLENLLCFNNQLINLDINSCFNLQQLWCWNNMLTSLNASSNSALYSLVCRNNQMTNLNLQNGNNTIFTTISTENNLQLGCIRVDDATWSTNNWLGGGWFSFDPQHYFSENCP